MVEGEPTIESTEKRRVRTVYTKEELQQLESIFTLQTQYPDLLMREQIAERLGITEHKIHVSGVKFSYDTALCPRRLFELLNFPPSFPPELVSEQKSEAEKAPWTTSSFCD